MARLRLTKEILETEQEAIFNSVGEGVIVTDEYARIVRVNPIALQLLGYEADELIGQWFPKVVVALNEKTEEVYPLERPMAKAFLTGKPIYAHLYYKTKKGDRLPVHVSVSPFIVNGQPTGAIEVFRDISMEESIEKIKSEFISLASHQLRTPLSSIKTYSHMLLEGYMGKVTPEQRPALEIIVAATNRMNELISTLLNISRLESGSVVIELKNIDISKIAKTVISDMTIPAKSRNISLNLRVIGAYPTKVFSDGPIINEVLSNLVSNSIKYSRDGGKVNITIRANRKTVTIKVQDAGYGIPELAQQQIFSKFYRASNVVQLETNGTGLGLYLVKGLVDELGGSIKFTSDEGTGTVFTVNLPRRFAKNKVS